jgi:hypothetical protein
MDAETGRVFTAHGRTVSHDHETLRNELKRAGVDHLRLETDQPIARHLRRFFAVRGLLGRGQDNHEFCSDESYCYSWQL